MMSGPQVAPAQASPLRIGTFFANSMLHCDLHALYLLQKVAALASAQLRHVLSAISLAGLWHQVHAHMQPSPVMYMALSCGGPDHNARNADWAGRSEAVPRNEKYNVKPYEPEDDDEYRTDDEKAAADPQGKAGAAVSGGVSNI